MMEKINKIIELLRQKTDERLVEWEKIDNGFLVSLNGKSYLTIQVYSENEYNRIYVLDIYNDQGYRIVNESTDSNQSHEFYVLMESLYNSAHDVFFQVNETLENLLDKLSNEQGKLGDSNFKLPAKDDDELPF